jgi:FixJ family two-component response regulator
MAPALVSVVDDDESVRESLPDLLKELGFAVQSLSNRAEVRATAQHPPPRCLIKDQPMPGM